MNSWCAAFLWMLFNVHDQNTFWISSSQMENVRIWFEIQCVMKQKKFNEMKQNKKAKYSYTQKTKAMIRLNDYHLYWWWFSCVLFCRLNIFVSHSRMRTVCVCVNRRICQSMELIELLYRCCFARFASAHFIQINTIFLFASAIHLLFVYQIQPSDMSLSNTKDNDNQC